MTKRLNDKGYNLIKQFVKSDYEYSADIFKALGHPTRLWIVHQIAECGECCVCEFVDAIGVDFSTISKHLSVLKNAGVIADDKRGKSVYYRLVHKCLVDVIRCEDLVR